MQIYKQEVKTMCRLLAMRSNTAFAIASVLKKFAKISRNSKEYQGHGWGCAWKNTAGNWKYYKNLKPIWTDNLNQFDKTTFFIAHARSAFEDRNIIIENNMPFYDNNYIFIFNGELRGVKIREQGRIGAEKIFNYIKRFDKGNMQEALEKATQFIKKRTTYIKALNIIITDREKLFIYTNFNENEDYFQMWQKQENNTVIICSDPLEESNDWQKIQKNTTMVI